MRKKGWSEAKIARSIAYKSSTHENQQRVLELQKQESLPQAEGWVSILKTILSSGTTPRIGLLLHFYDQYIATEHIVIKDRINIVMNGLDPKVLVELEEDVLYDFSLM